MPLIDRQEAALLLIDFQSRLMPVIDGGDAAIANGRRLIQAARKFSVPILFTEENAEGLGATVAELEPDASFVAHKMTFDACLAPDFQKRLPARRDLVVAGCEAHVCVLQTGPGIDARKAPGLSRAGRGRVSAARKQGDGNSPHGAKRRGSRYDRDGAVRVACDCRRQAAG